MNNRAFYHRQRIPNIFYFLGLGFFGLMVLACIIGAIEFFVYALIKMRSPEVIYGYSKEWDRLAKRDFEGFLLEISGRRG